MKTISACLLAILLLYASPLLAENATMTRGFYLGVENSRVVIALPNGEKKYFDINAATNIVNPGRPGGIARVPRHSIVQVVSKDDVAVEIVVAEVTR